MSRGSREIGRFRFHAESDRQLRFIRRQIPPKSQRLESSDEQARKRLRRRRAQGESWVELLCHGSKERFRA